MNQRAGLLLNLVFFATSAWLAADIVLVGVKGFLTTDRPGPALKPPPQTAVATFRPASVSQTSSSVIPAVSIPSSTIHLTGVVPGPGGYAVFSGLEQGQMLFRLGQTVPGHGRLVSVDNKSAIIEGQSGRIVHGLYETLVNPTANIKVKAPDQGNRRIMNREGLMADLNNLPTLLKQVLIEPHQSQGRVDGFRISNIPVDSLFGRLGLWSGDVVQQVNGVALTDMDVMVRLMQQLKDASAVSMDIMRGPYKQTLYVEIR